MCAWDFFWGNARVSTRDQNLRLQLTALQGNGAARIFADNGVGGSMTERPQLSKAMESWKPVTCLQCGSSTVRAATPGRSWT